MELGSPQRWEFQERKKNQKQLLKRCYCELIFQSHITAYNYWLSNFFRYHLVESVCIFPNTLTPVFKFPYQLNLFISALFSFSGIFNSLIFFLAQLGLIFSPSNSQTETDPQIQWHRRHEKSASWQGSNYISTRRPTASECITSDLGGNHSSQFQAYNSRMLPEAGPSLIRNSDSASGVPSDIQ